MRRSTVPRLLTSIFEGRLCLDESATRWSRSAGLTSLTAMMRRSGVVAVWRVKPARVSGSAVRVGLVDRCVRKTETSCLWMVKRSRAAGWPLR